MSRDSKRKRNPTGRTPGEISDIMRKVAGRDTAIEVEFRRALWARGMRFRTCVESLPGKPDVILTKSKLAIFIDGDYWHGNQWRRRGLTCLEEQFEATGSQQYWLRKIRRNMERDCAATARLLEEGWTILRFWESDLKRNLDACAEQALACAQAAPPSTPAALLPAKTAAEFFAGIGLMRLGLDAAGWKTIFATDIDPKKRAAYSHHFGDGGVPYRLEDIHALRPDDIPSVSLATASFPCNDLSLAGGRRGFKGRHSSAYWGFVRLLEEMGRRRPPLVLIENVAGFLSSNGGRDFEAALLALNQLGYAVDALILDAAHFTPQSRPRLFVIGALGQPAAKPAGPLPSLLRPNPLITFIAAHPKIDWRIRNLPAPPEPAHTLSEIVERLENGAPEWWSAERAAYLLSQMNDRHRTKAEQMMAGERLSYGAIFRRVRHGVTRAELRTDGLAGCLRTPRGGSARQILFQAGHGEYRVRLFTPRECARLMGAPDYRFAGSVNQALFGMGDAVCVPAITWLATYHLNPLVNESLRGIPLRSPEAKA